MARGMTHDDLMAHLAQRGLDPDDGKDTSEWMLSSQIIRCTNAPVVAVGGNRSKDTQIHGVVDAVHWYLQSGHPPVGMLTIIFGRRGSEKTMAEVLDAADIMRRNLVPKIDLTVEVDGAATPFPSEPPGYPADLDWMTTVIDRDGETPPPLAEALSERVDDDSFRWYRNVTQHFWSGRVEGLQVCTVRTDGTGGCLDVGAPGKNKDGLPRQVFHEFSGHRSVPFGSRDMNTGRLTEVAGIIKRMAASRKRGRLAGTHPESILESMVLRGALTVTSPDGQLAPVTGDHPFQFPTLWSSSGKPRFVDALMHIGDTPWVVELKAGGSAGQYYRHAITQAVLYRQFIRRAANLHGWFSRRWLQPEQCKAAIAFPTLASPGARDAARREKLLGQLKTAAAAFDVAVIEIEGFPEKAAASGRYR